MCGRQRMCQRDGRWVFNAPFYFLLNLAVGGDWPGPPNETTPSPAEMVVDYVRVYKAARIEAPKMTAAGAVKSADGWREYFAVN